MSQRSLRNWIEGSDYEDKWSQWANDMGWMSNHKKSKDKSEKKREQEKNVTMSCLSMFPKHTVHPL